MVTVVLKMHNSNSYKYLLWQLYLEIDIVVLYQA